MQSVCHCLKRLRVQLHRLVLGLAATPFEAESKPALQKLSTATLMNFLPNYADDPCSACAFVEHRIMMTNSLPIIIQGGMGIGVSNWTLARAVSGLGQLGVVSGTALDSVLVRRLQLGDLTGDIRRALSQFPVPQIASQILDRYFVKGGKPKDQPYRNIPMPSLQTSAEATNLTVAANFVEVFLAKENHQGLVGINLLEKVQLPTLTSIFGAMLAGVDYVLMGAGIPRLIPGVLDAFSEGKPASLKISVENSREEVAIHFDPASFLGGLARTLKRPNFLAIISSATLALTLAKKSNGKVDGFVVEGASAGGHNAPPRGALQLNESGEPVYGERDVADLQKIKDIGLPFWLAGSYGAPGKLAEAQALGAVGIQVGTAFAFCEESGISADLKKQVVNACAAGKLKVFTDPLASPTGFPFKTVQLEQTIGDPKVYAERERVCDLGYLREPFKREDGSIGFRCPAESPELYERKGGSSEQTAGRKCLCNGLMATIGLGQLRAHGVEAPLVTAGDCVNNVAAFLKPGAETYTAKAVVDALLL